ncbi:serine/threonine protein phosphatase 1 [Rhodoblastus acidophilus]|uniref:metallophosphoesterase family protein n=1 Tax=Rhodoblastus acidophilus TaxID=1074 RepID=UPI0022247DBC|nr:metallophosphoesterase family protein [Rhodoblastus acidophilus]MCW2283827.1 serine/threonine protein phosphatase 1 [Rhodoblastus acidophilus]MCW2335635.1 serine/threonine protein phosphatase 1 [Rhodoblastus acidophilus]
MPISRIAGFFAKKEAAPPRVPENARLYVIGDVHGRLDLLHDLELRIEADLATAPERVLTIFVGDYVDRGGDSAGVLDRLSAGEFCTDIACLRGNHEEVMLQFLSDESVLDSWRKFGGLETLHSYGVNVADVMRGAGYDRAQVDLLRVLPTRHREFLEKTRLSLTVGDYFFCHAGVRPGVPLENQSPHDLLWIREEFIRNEASFGKVVVHGHTPTAAPEVKSNRINVDTGAYASSILTALVLEGDAKRFLATGVRRADLSRM